MNKTEKCLELMRKYLIDDNHTCGETLKIFENYGAMEEFDFIDCRNCGANFSIEACNLQKQTNYLRMTELVRKIEKSR